MTKSVCMNDKCTGCGFCEGVCPSKAITMKESLDGFLYPQVNKSLCINCGLCTAKCSVLNNSPINNKCYRDIFAAYNIDDSIRDSSSSGGIFYLLASYVINHGGMVYGAALSYDCKAVQHIPVDCVSDLRRIMGSKYIQSDLRGVYPSIKVQLDAGRVILFSGTPCQIVGLKRALNKDYDNLITVDFVCHGVPSPKVWRKYISEIEKNHCSIVKSVSFRDKRYGWKNYSLVFTLDNGTEVVERITESPYLKGFVSNLTLRKSCYSCKFKEFNRLSDFTLADCWGAEQFLKDINDDKGISAIIVNTEKGVALINKLKGYIKLPLDYSAFVEHNPSFLFQPLMNYNRSVFFKGFDNHILREWLVLLNSKSSLLSRLQRKIYRMKMERTREKQG